jgi:hypothetical protein
MKRVSKIVKRKDGYYVLSEKGKNLGGPYSEDGAKERLRQVEYFKNKSGSSIVCAELLKIARILASVD